ncbi:MAG: radical SAM protein [Candidatus Aenigmatarchaeota archaeon]
MERIERLKRAVEDEEEIGPELVMISPTDKCNLRCRTCWRRNKEGEEFERGLSLEKVKDILNDCEKLDVRKIDLTGGGEPFLRNDIFEMINAAKSRGFEVGLTTNASLLDQDRVQRIVDLGMDEVLLSLDGLQETNDFLRGEGVFKDVMKAVKLFNKMKFDGALGFSTVISSVNYDELFDVVKLAEENNLDYVNFIVLNVWDSNRQFSIEEIEDEVIQSLKDIKEFEKESKVSTNADNIINYGLSEREPPEFCFAPWDMAFINASGEMMACCTLASYYKNILGNLEENSFYELWTGEKMKAFREEIKNGEFPEKCNECLPDFIEKYNETCRRLEEHGFKD